MDDCNNDPMRGTGRTTGLMLKAIGEALLKQGEWIEFVDHAPTPSRGHASIRKDSLIDLAESCRIKAFRVEIVGPRVFVISLPETRCGCCGTLLKQYGCPPLPTSH